MQGDFSRIGRDLSILDRQMKMYYDRGLSAYKIGWGQQFYLEYVYDNPGAQPQQVAEFFQVDKATITKTLKKLLEISYIRVETDERDRRVHHLYVTEEAISAVLRVKELHREFYHVLTGNLSSAMVEDTERSLEEMIGNMNQVI